MHKSPIHMKKGIEMRKYLYTGLVVLAALLAFSCGTTEFTNPNNPNVNPDANLLFGSDDSFDVVTWNLRTFPLADPATSELLALIIPKLKVDVIACQEIMSYGDFIELAEMIPHFEARVSNVSNSYLLAYLYDTRTVEVNSDYAIFLNDSNPFPRPPHVMDLNFNGHNVFLINNHLKAFGDNYIDEDDPWDEEYRRRTACRKLDQYIASNLGDEKVIVLGDMNDQIAEPAEYNVFLSFLDKPQEYLFTDMHIALNPNYSNVSYPPMVSHIDHILISNELFPAWHSSGSSCRVIKVEDWFGNWASYSNQISDHRPLGLRIPLD